MGICFSYTEIWKHPANITAHHSLVSEKTTPFEINTYIINCIFANQTALLKRNKNKSLKKLAF